MVKALRQSSSSSGYIMPGDDSEIKVKEDDEGDLIHYPGLKRSGCHRFPSGSLNRFCRGRSLESCSRVWEAGVMQCHTFVRVVN